MASRKSDQLKGSREENYAGSDRRCAADAVGSTKLSGKADFAMTTALALATLATAVGCAPPAVLASERLPAMPVRLSGGIGAAPAEPQSDRASSAPASCPYRFGSAMPAATFCVYRGVAFGSGGEVCATDVAVIWSSFDAQSKERVGPAPPADSNREVYLGFVADPELVLRAVVDSRQGDHAEMVGYSIGSEEGPQPLAGETRLRSLRLGASGTADLLSMELREPRGPRAQGCAFAAYEGTFLGVIRPPSETKTSTGSIIAPPR